MLVIHATVGNAASSLAWLCNPVSKASTNYLIDKAGHIYCLVPDSEAAWHAGVSAWRGLNSAEIQHRSLGIELENANNGKDPYPQAQMGALLWLARQKVAQYHITPEWVVRHLDIAMPKGRKTDPAGFPWEKFKADVFAPANLTARVKGVPVYQRQDRRGTIAGYLNPGDVVEIDATYPDGGGHLKSGLGFIDLGALE